MTLEEQIKALLEANEKEAKELENSSVDDSDEYTKLKLAAYAASDKADAASRNAFDKNTKALHSTASSLHKYARDAHDALDKYRGSKNVDVHLTSGDRAFEHGNMHLSHHSRAYDLKESAELEKSSVTDSVEDEPAVKIDNPMNPELQGEETPEAEIEAAEEGEDEEKDEKADVKESIEVSSIADLLAEDFSDEFKLKAQIIFEAAVKEQVAQIKAQLQEAHDAKVVALEEEFQDKLAQETQRVLEEQSDKIDGYLSHLAEEWKEDNIIALEAGIKSELTESFMGALKQVFESHYMEVPTDKVDLYQKVIEEKTEVESNLSKAIMKAQKLQEEVAQFKRAEIIEESVKGLTDLDAEKLKTLVEDFEFVDAGTFEKKVAIVKSSFFEQRQGKAKEQLTEDFKKSEPIIEVQEQLEESVKLDPAMAAYVNALRS